MIFKSFIFFLFSFWTWTWSFHSVLSPAVPRRLGHRSTKLLNTCGTAEAIELACQVLQLQRLAAALIQLLPITRSLDLDVCYIATLLHLINQVINLIKIITGSIGRFHQPRLIPKYTLITWCMMCMFRVWYVWSDAKVQRPHDPAHGPSKPRRSRSEMLFEERPPEA